MLKHLLTFSLTATLGLSSLATQAENITVFAAASMTNVLQQIGEEYQKQFPGDTLTFSFAGSSTLAKQILQDAPADIFVSADQKWMDYLAEKQPDKPQNVKILAENALVLIAPVNSTLHVNAIQEIDFKKEIGQAYLAIGDDHVPVGRYAKKALIYLNQWADVEARLAKGKDVRAVLAYIERGELPLGIVYSTDAQISQKVKIVAAFPPESYGKVVYPTATLTEKMGAKRFFDFLSSQYAQTILAKSGFKPVE